MGRSLRQKQHSRLLAPEGQAHQGLPQIAQQVKRHQGGRGQARGQKDLFLETHAADGRAGRHASVRHTLRSPHEKMLEEYE